MGKPWCADLPVVTVPIGEPKRVTFIYPFYMNHEFFARQVDGWRSYPDDLCERTSAIVVDDGSPVPMTLPSAPPFPMRGFRIEQDVRWNWLAARNIGAHYADDGWLLLTDMDHVVPADTLRSLIYGQHDPRVVYVFSRKEHTGDVIGPHSASFFMTRKLFWAIGGYDETLSGHYGTDGDWRRRVALSAKIQILTDVLVRYEYQGDSSTTRYKRKQLEDAAVKRLVSKRGKHWTPKTLSFPYHEVTL